MPVKPDTINGGNFASFTPNVTAGSYVELLTEKRLAFLYVCTYVCENMGVRVCVHMCLGVGSQ